MVLFGGLWTTFRRSEDPTAHNYQYHYDDDDRRGCDDEERQQQQQPFGSRRRVTFNGENENGGADGAESDYFRRRHADDRDDEEPSLTVHLDLDGDNADVLKLCGLYTLSYVFIAVIAYSYVFEHWTIIDSVYFAVATFTTVGYGDLQPQTERGQLFTIFFAVYGVIILGIFIGIVGHAISSGQSRAIRNLHNKSKRKLLKVLFNPNGGGGSNGTRPSERDKLLVDEKKANNFLVDHVTLLDDVCTVVRAEAPEILVVMLLAYILGVREGWSFTSTMYFCIMSASTTGYGDYTPATQADKLYCIFFLPLSVAVFGEVLGRIASIYITRRTRQAEYKHLKRSITQCDLRKMDSNRDGKVDMEEFMSFMLVALQKVDQESIDDIKSIFYSLDANGNGVLEKDDLVALSQRRTWHEIQMTARRAEDDEDDRHEQ